MAVQVVVDPGHYDKLNPGICTGFYEGERMLVLGKHLANQLQKRGAEAFLTRESNNVNPSYEARGGLAKGKDLFISLHSDASGGEPPNPDVRGVTMYYSVKRPNSLTFANTLGYHVANVMGTPFRGSIARPLPENTSLDYYAVLRYSIAAGVKTAFLAEHGYHTNPKDCTFLMNNDNLQKIARIEANVICTYYELGWMYTVKSGDTLYAISRRVFVSWEKLMYINDIGSDFVISPGQILFIPY